MLLNLNAMDAVLVLPSSERQTVRVQGGMRVKELNSVLHEAGWALPNLGAIAMQSVAGATSTSTHGTGRELGSMSSQIVSMALVRTQQLAARFARTYSC